MLIFLDANIIVSVLNKEYPLYSVTARILSLPPQRFTPVISTLSLGIAFYFASKKHGASMAKKKLGILLEHVKVATCGEAEALAAVAHPAISDFEDGMQYYSARNAGCRLIVTSDVEDYHFSEMEVLKPEDFWARYV